ncbi:MAG: phosphoribosylglycinamide formyltransferase [Sedimentisphaerales bacterium]|nr:phosphoribosylglycinamide formyltransferase [Sedimentisphaerales bacterium]
MKKHFTIYTDGGSRGNPGEGAAAFVILDKNKKIVAEKAVYLKKTTNNIAEYTAMLNALKDAKKLDAASVDVFSDSELMVRQINGQYKVKSNNLKDLNLKCLELLENFQKCNIMHIRREKNTLADKLANKAMNMKKNIEITHAKKKNKKLRIAILLSGGGRTMMNIQKNIDAGDLDARIVLVISSRSTVKGIDRARQIGLEPVIIRKKDYQQTKVFSKRIAEELDKAKVDLVVQAGWLCLWFIPKKYEGRVMNIHPALLPSFGGKGMWGHHVHQAVIDAGCKVSGCTVHFCTNEYDKGSIIEQESCEVRPDDDADSLAARVFEKECIAYPNAIRRFIEKNI